MKKIKKSIATVLVLVIIVGLLPKFNSIVKAAQYDAMIGTTSYTSLSSAITNVADGNTIELQKDIEINSTIVLTKDINITIDGNGHKIIFNDRKEDNYGMEISGGKVTLRDIEIYDKDNDNNITSNKAFIYINTNKSLTFENGVNIHNCVNKSVNNSNGGAIYNNGSFIMNGGKISNCTVTKGTGGAIYGGNITINSGDITSCSATNGGGIYSLSTQIVINGGNISNCTATEKGGGIYGNDVDINGGNITNCKAENGGGVYTNIISMDRANIDACTATIRDGGGICGNTITINSGSVTNCNALDGGGIYSYVNTILSGGSIYNCNAVNGGGIYNEKELTIVGGNIYNCDATNGGGIYNESVLNINGGNISTCDADIGGGIYNDDQINITKGTITQCNALKTGGGIYNNCVSRAEFIIKPISVTINIIGNNTTTTSGNKIANNVVIYKGMTLYVEKSVVLLNDSRIGITAEDNKPCDVVISDTDNNINTFTNNFISDNENYIITPKENNNTILILKAAPVGTSTLPLVNDNSKYSKILEVTGSITKKVTTENDAMPEVTLDTAISTMSSLVFTKEEEKIIKKGINDRETNAVIRLHVSSIGSAQTVADKKRIVESVTKKDVGSIFDLSLSQTIYGYESKIITSTEKYLQLSVIIPDILINTNKYINRTYSICNIHNDEVTILNSTYDSITNKLKFDTNAFSTYAILYHDEIIPNTSADINTSKDTSFSEILETDGSITAKITTENDEMIKFKLDATISDLKNKLFTDAEKNRISNGEDTIIRLNIKNVSSDKIDEDEAKIQATLTKEEIGILMDISLTKKIGNDAESYIPKTDEYIQISMIMPDDLINTDTSIKRTYNICNIHDNEVTKLNSVYDETTKTLKFQTKSFSTYGVLYTDTALASNEQSNSNGTNSSGTNTNGTNNTRTNNTGTNTNGTNNSGTNNTGTNDTGSSSSTGSGNNSTSLGDGNNTSSGNNNSGNTTTNNITNNGAVRDNTPKTYDTFRNISLFLLLMSLDGVILCLLIRNKRKYAR